MKPARIAVLGIALAAGGGAALLMSGGDPPPPPPAPTIVQAPPAMKTVDVLVAGIDVGLGRTIKPGDLRWQSWPEDAASSGYIRRTEAPDGLEQTAGAIARTSFLSGEPIRRERLIKADGSGFMSAILPTGMRAAAISIDTRGATSAGGFVLPNDRVDVIRTYRDEEASRAGGTDVHQSITILTNIRVLAIGQNVQERDGEKVVTGETATLEVTPTQAELLALAQKVGQLSLVLRSLADANQVAEVVREDGPLTIVRHGVAQQAPRR